MNWDKKYNLISYLTFNKCVEFFEHQMIEYQILKQINSPEVNWEDCQGIAMIHY